MKKLLLTLTVCIITLSSFSQTRFGLVGGLNFASQKLDMSFDELGFGQKGKTIVSFHAGAFADILVGSSFSVRPELLFSGKGSNFEIEDEMGETYVTKLRPYYLDLPVSVMYTHELNNNMSIFGGFGPVVSLGLFGKMESDGESEDYFQDEAFKRLDFGLKYQVGVNITNNIFVGAHYTQGLANTADSEDADIDLKWKNNVIGVSIGYYLGRR